MQQQHPTLAAALKWETPTSLTGTNPAAANIVNALDASVIKTIAALWGHGYAAGEHDDAEVGRIMRESFERQQRHQAALYEHRTTTYLDPGYEENEQQCVVAITRAELYVPAQIYGPPENCHTAEGGDYEIELRDADGYHRPDWEDAVGQDELNALADEAFLSMHKQMANDFDDSKLNRAGAL